VRKGRIDQAIVELQTALKNNPKYAEAQYDLGNALYEKGDLEGAKANYLVAARLDPRRGPVHNMLGIVSIRQGEISQAIAQFNEALRLQPDDVYAAENLRRAQAMETKSTSRPR
jgi:tetratricopeptide (TPR) repeat protein